MKKDHFNTNFQNSFQDFFSFFIHHLTSIETYIFYSNIDRKYTNKMVLQFYLNGSTLDIKQNLKKGIFYLGPK